MTRAQLEHVNYSTPDPIKTAQLLVELFDWKIRWQGIAMETGFSVHVGNEAQYIALYCPAEPLTALRDPHGVKGGLKHIGICVADIDETEAKVKMMGFTPYSHGDYEPGRRFILQTAMELNLKSCPMMQISSTPFASDVLGAVCF